MMGNFPVLYNGQPIGNMQVKKVGLYYSFTCKTDLSCDGNYSVYVVCGEEKIALGRCYLFENTFGLKTKVAAKRFPEGDWEFWVYHTNSACNWIVDENKPFLHLDQLERVRLSLCNGVAVIVPK